MKTEEAAVSCPAKINLFLEVKGRRSDGFHEVETVMQSICLFDELVFRRRPAGIRITCSDPGVPVGKDNLVWKAAALVAEETGAGAGIDVSIEKNIPPGSGLGGGSSNAAGTFIALNRLWGLGLERNDVLRLAEKIGTDVSFFACLIDDDVTGFSGGTFSGKGRGDKMRRMKHLPQAFVVLAIPPVFSSTERAYSMLDWKPGSAERDMAEISEAIDRRDLPGVSGCLFNRLEEAVFRNNPPVRDARDDLIAAGARGALMTGSGSGVFALAADFASASKIAESVSGAKKGVKTYVIRTW